MDGKTKEQPVREFKAALMRTQEEKNRSDAIITGLGGGIIIQDTEYKILYQNQKPILESDSLSQMQLFPQAAEK
jgi:transcriptional regulator of NAD metabolism